jgi:cell division protein FtsA
MKAARPERDLIHCFPLHYYVDDTPNIMNPIGLQAKKLKGKLHMIDASASGIFNLAHCLAKCHLDVENYATSSIAASLSSTKEDEKALGTIVFDCGASTTSLAAFEKGVCVYSTSVNIGGQHVTNDLAIGLSTSLEAAERIKILHGHLLPSPRHLQDTIEIPETQPDGRMQMTMATKSQIIDIIRPRIEELFEWLATKMHNDGFYPRGNIVLTGGASQLGGLKEYIAQLHGVPVRMGRPTYLKGMAENTQGTSFSVCAGLLHFSLDQSSEAPIDVRDSHKKAGSPINRLVRWIKEYA